MLKLSLQSDQRGMLAVCFWLLAVVVCDQLSEELVPEKYANSQKEYNQELHFKLENGSIEYVSVAIPFVNYVSSHFVYTSFQQECYWSTTLRVGFKDT